MQGCSIFLAQGIALGHALCALAYSWLHKCYSWCIGKGRTCAPQGQWRRGGRRRPPPPARPPRCLTGCGSHPVSCCPLRPAHTPPRPAVKAIDPHHMQPFALQHESNSSQASTTIACVCTRVQDHHFGIDVAPESCTRKRDNCMPWPVLYSTCRLRNEPESIRYLGPAIASRQLPGRHAPRRERRDVVLIVYATHAQHIILVSWVIQCPVQGPIIPNGADHDDAIAGNFPYLRY